MLIEETIEIKATAEQIFNVYKNIDQWVMWDNSLTSVYLDNGLCVGSRGWLKPRSGPKAAIMVIEVENLRSFTVESKLPLGRMTFGHEIVDFGDNVKVTHWAKFSGPLSFIFSRLIGPKIKQALPAVMVSLKKMVESI